MMVTTNKNMDAINIEKVLLCHISSNRKELLFPIRKKGRPNIAESANSIRLRLYKEMKKEGNSDSMSIII